MNMLDRALCVIRPFSEVILLLVLFGATLWLRLSLSDLIVVRRTQAWINIGPDAWPRFLIDAALLCLVLLIVYAVMELRQKLATGQQEDGVTGAELIRWISIIALIVVYIWSLRYTGFLLSTYIFGVIYCIVTGLQRPREFLGLPAAFIITALLLFTKLLSVPLPRGVGVFRSASYYVY